MLIDLGEDRSAPEPPPRPARHRRAWLVAGVVLAALLGLAGSAPPPRPPLVPLLRVPFAPSADFAMAPGTVAVLVRGSVTGYALPSGTRLWTTPVPVAIERIAYLPGSTALVAIGEQEFAVAGLDYRTGRILWQRTGAFLAGQLPERHLVIIVEPASDGPGEISGIDVDTGHTLWRRSAPPGSDPVPSWPLGGTAWYGIEEADGTLEVIDETTGALVSRSAAALSPYPSSAGAQPVVSLVGRSLLAVAPDSTAPTLVASDPATGAPRWRLPLAIQPQEIAPCGQLVCLFSPGTIALDPDTGAVRWQTSQWQTVDDMSGGLSLLGRVEQGQTTALAVVRQGTTNRVLDLTGWLPIANPAAVPLLVARQTRDVRTWFAAVDLPAGGLLPLGSATGLVMSACWSTGPYVACPTVHRELQVWRYTPR